jgi:hypothetical protein
VRARPDVALAVLAVAVAARPQQQHGGQPDPAADGVHDHAAGEVVELGAGQPLDPGLDAETLVPGDAFEHRVHQAHQHRGGDELRAEARPFGDAAGDDGGNRRREGQQEEELHQFVAVLRRQRLGTDEEADAVGHGVADEEVGDGRDREVDQDLHQRIDLVLLAHRAQFQEGEAGVHGQHHHGTEQDEKGIGALAHRVHVFSPPASAVVGGSFVHHPRSGSAP